MNFIYPTTATFPEFDGYGVDTTCMHSEGWTRLIYADKDDDYFEEIQNDDEKIKVRGINNVPDGTYNQAITFLALQPRCTQRQITISAHGLLETVNSGYDRLRMWETNYTEARGWYWRETNRFPSITFYDNNTQASATYQNYPFESVGGWYYEDPNDQPYGADDLGVTVTTTPLVKTLEPQPCPYLMCFTFSTGDSLNNCGGEIFIELEITLDS